MLLFKVYDTAKLIASIEAKKKKDVVRSGRALYQSNRRLMTRLLRLLLLLLVVLLLLGN